MHIKFVFFSKKICQGFKIKIELLRNVNSLSYFLYSTIYFTNHNLLCIHLIFLIKLPMFKMEKKNTRDIP